MATHERVEAAHKYAYRVILVSILLIDYVQPEWAKYVLKAAPYTVLAFDFYLYSPLLLIRGLLKCRTLKLLVAAATISMALNTYSHPDTYNQYGQGIAILREDTR